MLVALAAGSVLTLFLGLPMLWTGHEPAFEQWLGPVLAEVHFAEAGHATEWLFQLLGVAAATIGLGGSPGPSTATAGAQVPARLKARFARAWTSSTTSTTWTSCTRWRWSGRSSAWPALFSWFDGRIIDGLVNLAGAPGPLRLRHRRRHRQVRAWTAR